MQNSDVPENVIDYQQVLERTPLGSIDHNEEIGSTNDRALDLAKDPALNLPALVITTKQTAGRGRGANQWFAGDGSLTFSLVVSLADLKIPPARTPILSLWVGMAIAQVVEAKLRGADVRVKWPNDVFVDGKKICGILIETSTTASGRVVIGVGLNVNNSVMSDGHPLSNIATSFTDKLGKATSLTDVVSDTVCEILKVLEASNAMAGNIDRLWQTRCLLTDRKIVADSQGQIIEGICQGIDSDGRLLISTNSGVVSCSSAVITSF